MGSEVERSHSQMDSEVSSLAPNELEELQYGKISVRRRYGSGLHCTVSGRQPVGWRMRSVPL